MCRLNDEAFSVHPGTTTKKTSFASEGDVDMEDPEDVEKNSGLFDAG